MDFPFRWAVLTQMLVQPIISNLHYITKFYIYKNFTFMSFHTFQGEFAPINPPSMLAGHFNLNHAWHML